MVDNRKHLPGEDDAMESSLSHAAATSTTTAYHEHYGYGKYCPGYSPNPSVTSINAGEEDGSA